MTKKINFADREVIPFHELSWRGKIGFILGKRYTRLTANSLVSQVLRSRADSLANQITQNNALLERLRQPLPSPPEEDGTASRALSPEQFCECADCMKFRPAAEV